MTGVSLRDQLESLGFSSTLPSPQPNRADDSSRRQHAPSSIPAPDPEGLHALRGYFSVQLIKATFEEATLTYWYVHNRAEALMWLEVLDNEFPNPV